ncbi:hypothetical protein FIBSPDRAFT_872898, partial [Athelia psychrophila]
MSNDQVIDQRHPPYDMVPIIMRQYYVDASRGPQLLAKLNAVAYILPGVTADWLSNILRRSCAWLVASRNGMAIAAQMNEQAACEPSCWTS